MSIVDQRVGIERSDHLADEPPASNQRGNPPRIRYPEPVGFNFSVPKKVQLLGPVSKLPFLSDKAVTNSGVAYGLSKRTNHLRVQAAAVAWGDHGARINSISPGIIITPLAQHEMSSAAGPTYRAMIEASATGRAGTMDDVAAAAAFLAGPEASFVTGSDLLIDGGVIAAMRSGRITLPELAVPQA